MRPESQKRARLLCKVMNDDNSSSKSSGKTDFGSRPEMYVSQHSIESGGYEPPVVPELAQFEGTHEPLHLTNQSRWFSSSNLDRRNRNALSETENILVRTTSLGELNQDHQGTRNMLNGFVRLGNTVVHGFNESHLADASSIRLSSYLSSISAQFEQ